MATLTEQDAYQLISDLEQYNQQRYTKLSSDQSAYLTILKTYTAAAHEKGVFYIIVVCPVFTEYTPEEIENVSFYQVYMNPSTTQLSFTPLADAIPLSYGVFRSSVFVSYQNENIPMLFSAPYVSSRQLPSLKETILSLFAFPTHMLLLYNSMFLQLNYIPTDPSLPQAYQVTLKGTYETGATVGSQSITLLDYFDFNKTLVLLDMFTNPCLVLNNQTMRIGNNQPYLYNPEPGNPLEIVVGFNYNYLTDNSTSTSSGVVNQMTREDGKRTLNLQGTTEIPKAQSLSYTSLASIVPLSAQDHIVYFLSGISALNYKHQPLSGQAGWAVVQVSNIVNSNSVVTSSSFALLYSTTRAGLTQYKSTSLWYSLDVPNQTLTVWQDSDPTTPSFLSYLLENKSTIGVQDVLQFPDQEFQEIVMDQEKRMGSCRWWDAKCHAETAARAVREAAERAARAIREAAEAAARVVREAAERAARAAREALERAVQASKNFAKNALQTTKQWAQNLKERAIEDFNKLKDIAADVKENFTKFVSGESFAEFISLVKNLGDEDVLKNSAYRALFPAVSAFTDFKNDPSITTLFLLLYALSSTAAGITTGTMVGIFAFQQMKALFLAMYDNNTFGFKTLADNTMSKLTNVLRSISF